MNQRWKVAQKLELWWWQHYLKGKDKAAYLEAKSTYWQRVLATLSLSMPADAKILDAGCGPAGIFIVLKNYQVDALDPLIDKYEQNLLHFKKEQYPSVQFYNQSLENFEIKKQYDVIFCMNAINHVSDVKASFDTLMTALATNGHLIMAVDVHRYSVLKTIFRAIPGDVLHPHQHSLADYTQIVERGKGQVVKTIHLKEGKIFDYVVMLIQKQTSHF